ncbi:MAG: hypothetical protein K6T91_08795 [Firmicutes bacterium]|nr:hypothetical protein [Bacillota bacterium]
MELSSSKKSKKFIATAVFASFCFLATLTGGFAEAAPVKTVASSAKHIKTSYKKSKKLKKKRKRYRRRRSLAKRRISISRGAQRTVSVEPIIRQVGAEYWPDPAQLDALVWICAHEATVPGTISKNGKWKGLFQLANPPHWMVLGDAASETKAGCEYIKRRYGTPLAAKAFHQRRGWY